jgi:RHS repeat-associated protein
VGAAGTGWDVPIAGVSRQRNLSRRKPVHRFAGEVEPATADRVFVDLGGGSMLMAPTESAGVFRAFGSGFYELTASGASFTGRDAEGRQWTFERIPALGDDELFPLARIEDASGVNRVDLRYEVFEEPKLGARELVLREVSYSHDASGQCPKYRIRLGYSVAPAPLGLEVVRGRLRSRSRLLRKIELVTAAETDCRASSLRTEATYEIEYQPDPMTGQPRLVSVQMRGLPEGTTPSAPLPVVAYHYGTALSGGELRYAEAEHILLPAGPVGGNRGLAATLGNGGGAMYGHVRGFHDMNGDGRMDFVTLDSASAVPVLAVNRPSALGNDFSTLPAQVDLPNEPAAPYNLGAPDLSFGLPVVAAIDNTFQQLIDFNGDGRLDIVVATDGRNDQGQRDPSFWKILVNRPGPSGNPADIVWLERNVDISALRAEVIARHTLSLVASSDQGAKALPLERTHQGGAFADNKAVESSVITQWRLLDVNGDGFPDFVFDSDGMTARTEERCDAAGDCTEVLRQDHVVGNRLMVFYHTGPMMAGSGAETQNVWRGPAVMLREDGACGVSRLVFTVGGIRQIQCGFMEANGDGLVDYLISDTAGNRVIRSSGLAQAHDVAQQEAKRAIQLPGPVGVVRDPRATVCGGGAAGNTAYDIEQISDLRDVTGDGIADYVFFGGSRMPPGNPEGPQGWWFMAGTGTGFMSARPIRSPGAAPFALHVSNERCNGTTSNITATLLDLDGDGRLEIVHSPNTMNVRVAKLTNADGERGAHDAGQITAVDNRFGSVTRFGYQSAKSDWLGRQNVPFPQIVVSEMEQLASFNLGTSMAPVRFAYGEPEQVYHPLLGRFVFRGFQRRIEIVGEETNQFDVVRGTVSVVSALRSIEFPSALEKLMLTGLPAHVRGLAGSAPVDPRRLLASVGSVPAVESSQRVWKTQQLPGAVPLLVPLEEECYGTPPPETPGEFGDLALCRRAAIPFVSEHAVSEGPQSFPHPDNVASFTRVTEVDDFARPLKIRLEGDQRRPEDDVCVEMEYAAPVLGAPLVLDVPKTIRSHECDNRSRVFATTFMTYDDLPHGQAGIGRPSGRRLDRRNLATGALLEEAPAATLRRDVFGNPVEVRYESADGASATTAVTWDPFGLVPVRSETTATGLAAPLVTSTSRHPSSLLPLVVTDTTGAAIHHAFDGFSRLQRISLTLPGDPQRFVLVDITLAGFDGAPTVRTVKYRTFHDFVPESQAANPPPGSFTTHTAVFDELGRKMHALVELGPDYDHASMVVDAVTYDTLGRRKFTADPFPASVFGPRYGTTTTYLADGRPECVIQGTGVQTEAVTDESVDRYPTCVTYAIRSGALVVQRRGPNELAAGKPQSGAFDEDVISATGQLLRRSRVKDDQTLTLAEYGYDRLGHPARLRRWAQPGVSPAHATWTWAHDSLGNVLELAEPAGLRQRFEYDGLGSLSAVRWTDSTGIAPLERAIELTHDGLGRLRRRVEVLNGSEQADTLAEYFYDVPAGQPQHLNPTFLGGRLAFARAGGRTDFFGYDALGRLTTRSYLEGAESLAEQVVLDVAGEPRSVQFLVPGTNTPPEELLYTYDSARRLRTIAFRDAAGVSELWRALETDVFGRVVRSRSGNGALEQFSYRDGGRRELQSRRLEVNGLSRLVQYEGVDGAGLVRGVIEQSDLAPPQQTTTRYTYDARDALERAVVEGPAGILGDTSYAYDGMGNLTTVTDALGAGDLEIRPDAADPDRVCAAVQPGTPSAPCTYRYDALGSVRSRRTTGSLFEYDGAGRLTSARDGEHRAALGYDALGSLAGLRVSDGQIERRESFFGAVSRVAFFDGAGNPIDVGAPGATLHSFEEITVASPLGTVAAIRKSDTGAGVILYPVGDPQGTRNVLAGDGTGAQAVAYDAYGNIVTDTGNPASLTFWPYQWNGGHLLDGLGLTVLGERVLDSRTGRFLQRDPVIQTASAVTAHPYAFAWNNPVTYVDPSGAEPANAQPGTRPPTQTTFSFVPAGPQTAAGRALKAALEEELGFEMEPSFNFDTLAARGISVKNAKDTILNTSWGVAAYNARNKKSPTASFFAGVGDTVWFWCPGCAANARRAWGIDNVDEGSWGYKVGSFGGMVLTFALPKVRAVGPSPSYHQARIEQQAVQQVYNRVAGVGPTGCANCVETAIAANATLGGRPTAAIGSGAKTGTVGTIESFYGRVFNHMALDLGGLARAVHGWGPGSRGIVWAERSGGQVGHAFNVVNQNGVVVFVDAARRGPPVLEGQGYWFFYLIRTDR